MTLFIMVAIVIVVLFLVTRTTKSGGGKNLIKAEEAKTLMGKPDVVLVDVRSKAEYQSGHINGAILLPLPQVGVDAEKALGSKDKTVIVYCQSGSRSKLAAMLLRRKGYQTVYDLGGIIAWPYEIV